MKKILVLNLGSTSFKCKLYEMTAQEQLLASGNVENIGTTGTWLIQTGTRKESGSCSCASHIEALEICLSTLSRMNVPVDITTLDAVGYKAVHGGKIPGAQLIDNALMTEMEHMSPMAPAHNPVYLAMMRSVRKRYPELKQIACFETAFHSTIPLKRAVYGVPYEWMERFGLRRYGFHGSSHSYIAWRLSQEAPTVRRLVSVHLGGSSSLCAILNGKSIATSMGASPQSGLFHNNRVGDFDVFCLPVLARELGGLDEAMHALSSRCGFLGLSGVSNDLRLVRKAAEEGNEHAALSIAAFADEIVGYIGMYTAYLGGVDAICFTGGIGLNDTELRAQVIKKLTFVNAEIETIHNVSGYQGKFSTSDSGVQLWALETNEEIMVARECMRVLNA